MSKVTVMKISLKKNSIYTFLIIFLFFVSQVQLPSYAIKHKADKTIDLKEEQAPVIVGKINFEDVLQKAKEHSYDLKIADYNVLIAKQEIRGAKSEYFPKLYVGGGYEYTKNFRDIRDTTVMSIGEAFINPYTRFQSMLGITLAYNLFDFGVRGGNLKVAKEEAGLKELQALQQMQEMSLTLLDTYSKILVMSKQIELNKEILSLEERNLGMRERLFEAKEISKTELDDSKVKVAQIKAKIADLKSIRQESINWLSFYTGETYDSDNLKIDELKRPDFDVTEFNDYTKSIVWKVHEKNIKKKELELYVAKRNNYPKINAYTRYYLYGSDYSNIGRSLGIEPSNFSVGGSFSMPIFDGFKNSANIEKTKLELKQLQVERDKAIAELMTKLATMRTNLIYLDEQITENNKAINELNDKEKSIHKLLSKQLVSPIDENDAKIELLNEKIELSKNAVTQVAITKGIQILTEEY